jgi:hypothetical protein
MYHKISEKGSLWILAENLRVKGEHVPLAYEIIDRISSLTEFKLKNVIVVYRIDSARSRNERLLTNAYFLIGHFVKSLGSSFFDKDEIREPHVFKRIEWGRRKTGKSGYSKKMKKRYNKRGRDPGNVFYRVNRDDTTGQMLSVKGFSDSEIFSRIIRMSSVPMWTIATNSRSKTLSMVTQHLGRQLVQIEMKPYAKAY